jgi:hypothetical protein
VHVCCKLASSSLHVFLNKLQLKCSGDISITNGYKATKCETIMLRTYTPCSIPAPPPHACARLCSTHTPPRQSMPPSTSCGSPPSPPSARSAATAASAADHSAPSAAPSSATRGSAA